MPASAADIRPDRAVQSQPVVGRGDTRAAAVGQRRFPGTRGVCMLCWLLTAPATAQVAIPAQRGASARSASCIEVAINDRPALSYDCLNRRLAAIEGSSAARAGAVDAVVREPGNRQVGQYNFSSLSHRMGASLGQSVIPQRPPALPRVIFPAPLGTH